MTIQSHMSYQLKQGNTHNRQWSERWWVTKY